MRRARPIPFLAAVWLVSDRISQPTGELRSRIVIQRHSAGWLAGFDMGSLTSPSMGFR